MPPPHDQGRVRLFHMNNHTFRYTVNALKDRIAEDTLTAEEAVDLWEDAKQRVVCGAATCCYQRSPVEDEMDALPAAMDTLSLADTVPSNRIDKIRRAIAELGVARGQTKLRQRLRVHAWHEGKSSHELFRSISTKFTDNAVPTLIPSESASGTAMDDALKWTEEHGVQDDLMHFKELLIPILTQLVNIWYKAGVFPPTFLQADIFCLKKSGDLSNPLNYRPFALLNSDYKIITRILATRMANLDDEQREALALLLDFQKAYDSLGRRYLIRA
ncbi:hypothetical protein PHYSODRAFT_333564 [Phytophthora sojae]|uniref:Reverse transcriptase domain-containing protein n=1 Tax=Phytophthora sojae (strain P6497) TaxID=1094619 RepID=G4ZLW0_PHYSP|nr:hypothetical protein PHYSODRAFT_333564 [Phytophthora sojae]EGZ15295.1 hypothetical protein PHYSODRAFT_333564 [Phytophthora sojae]|eukprot:XP_009529044.1 hypothetical protein PHYSODRAFT_333564 [Phytophthora sojae]